MTKLICENCGKCFEVDVELGNWDKNNNQIKRNGGVVSSKRFCSWKCGMESNIRKMRRTCIEKYGKPFQQTNDYKANRKARLYGDPNHSTFRCVDIPNVVVEKICENCGKTYKINFADGKVWTKNEEQVQKGKRAETVNAYKYCSYKCGRVAQKKKRELTNLKNHGVKNAYQCEKSKEKMKEKYGFSNPFLSDDIQRQIKQTNVERFGFTNPMKLKTTVDKGFDTKRRKGCCGKSKAEERIYKQLKDFYGKVIRNYSCERYPYHCDFYIPEEDLFIEYQGWWGHGPCDYHESFDENNPNHIQKVKEMKAKHRKSYDLAILNWTIRDPEKRKCAKDNNLNFIEFFTEKDFEKWLERKGLLKRCSKKQV